MKYLKLFLLSWFLFWIGACSETEKLATNFQDEVPIAGNLEFTFDKNVAESHELNRWQDADYIKFTPEIQGRFKWVAPNKLVFSPAHYLFPSTNYKAEIVDAKLKAAIEQKVFEFHTPYLKLQAVKGFWAEADELSGTPKAHFSLDFNYKVNPAKVGERLEIGVQGQNKNFKVATKNPDKTILVYLLDLEPEDREIQAKVTLKKGLAIKQSVPIAENKSVDVKLSSPFEMSILGITATHDGFFGTLKVKTSQEVLNQNIKDYIRINPKADFSVETNKDHFSIISEDFDSQKRYEITIKSGLKGRLGGTLKNDYTEGVAFGKIRPAIDFVNQKGIYLSRRGKRNIEVNVVNVENVKVKIYKVYQNNILSFLGSHSYYSGYSRYVSSPNSHGDLVYEKEFRAEQLEKNGNHRVLKMDFPDKLKDYNGFYVVEVESEENYWVRDRKIISISDIGLIARKGKEKITVFANSIHTLQPIQGVNLTFIGKNNQVAGKAITDARGVAVFEQKNLLAENFAVELVTAKHNSDFNFLLFNRSEINTSDFDVGGRTSNPAGYDAFIYGDRDIYRPGETAYLSAIIRDEQWNTPGEMPLKMKVLSPNGKNFKTIRLNLNEFGSFETTIDIPASALTGTYSAELYTTTDVLVGSKRFAVEEFMPDRIKVEVDLNKTYLKPNERFKLELEAVNFFGPPAANRNYEVEMSTKRRAFRPKGLSEYNFSIEKATSYFKKQVVSGKTNAQGKATEDFTVPYAYKDMGVLQSDFFVTVFDETGRPVNRLKTIDIYTQDVFYGIKRFDYYVGTGSALQIPLIAVNKDGNVLNGVKAKVQVIKHEYKTVLAKSGSYFRYRSEHEEVVLKEQTLTLNGKNTTLSFTPKTSGRYDVRVSAPEITTYIENSFYAYGYGRTSYSSFQVNNEGSIDIEFDKESYQTGDKANVLLKTPFSGKVLITVENDEVIDHFYLNTDKRALNFTLDIKEEFVPNVYITATLFKQHVESDLPLTVAHGFAPLKVENPSRKIDVKLSAAQQSESKKKQKITVRTKPNAAVTVAVVDEGILQLTGYQTPDPYEFFYRKRALEVKPFDIYPYLLPEFSTTVSSPGGGSLNKRLNPLTNRRVKLVAFWSGILKANGSGIATYEIEIPQFSGDLRIMAASYKGNSFGASATNMKVADPVVISTALPRFLSPRDTLIMPVTLTNTTNSRANCKASLSVSGPLKVVGSTTQTISVGSNAEQQIDYKLVAKPNIGQAKVKVSVEALNREFYNETDITVRPASPLQKLSGSGSVQGGQTKSVAFADNDFIPSSVDKTLIVSNSPLIQFTDDLDYLVRYPYGCVEQTVSSVFPQLYLADLAKSLFNQKTENPNVAHHIQTAINKLKLMQLYNGGLTYWPGGGKESWWGTIYAAHFLLEAQNAGYEVDSDLLENIFKYLKTKLKDKKTEVYYYNRYKRKIIAPKEVPYSLYVMALADKAPRSTMNYYKSRQELLSLDGKYLLAAAYALSGDKEKFRQMLPPQFAGETSVPTFGGSFYSPIRDQAIALNALIESDPDNTQIGIMARHLSQSLKNEQYLNTQERSFGLLALGKIAKRANQTELSATIKAGNNTASYNQGVLKLKTSDLTASAAQIAAQGSGELFYFWEVEGISASGKYKQEDNFLKVRRQFYDRYGRPIHNNRFTQNDLIVVQIGIESQNAKKIENVVITDILPAGFEIENPRISKVPGMDWIKNKSYPEHTDIRDDRVIFFLEAGKMKYYYYVVRAVSPGTFQMGPVGADAMYNGEYHSYWGGRTVYIEKR